MNQSEYEALTRSWRKARKNASVQVAIQIQVIIKINNLIQSNANPQIAKANLGGWRVGLFRE